MNNSVKNHIEIQGVILTPEAIAELKEMQAGDNAGLNHHMERIGEAACFIGSIFYLFNSPEEKETAAQTMSELCSFRNYLKNLKKP